MLKTLKLPLQPTPDQHDRLLATMHCFNAACTWIATPGAGPPESAPSQYGRAGSLGPKEPWRPAADHAWRRPLLRPQRTSA